jgi:hypothetical protein
MQAFGRNQITSADELNEYRMSNKVYPPSAAPQATREFRMMKTNGQTSSIQPKNMAKQEDRIQETVVSRIAKAGILEEWCTPYPLYIS